MSTIVAMPVRVKPPPADTGETISPRCASLETTMPPKGARVGIVELREHLSRLDLHALVDVDLVDARSDFGGDRRALARRDVAARVQERRAASLVGAHRRHLDLRSLLAQRDEQPGGGRE